MNRPYLSLFIPPIYPHRTAPAPRGVVAQTQLWLLERIGLPIGGAHFNCGANAAFAKPKRADLLARRPPRSPDRPTLPHIGGTGVNGYVFPCVDLGTFARPGKLQNAQKNSREVSLKGDFSPTRLGEDPFNEMSL